MQRSNLRRIVSTSMFGVTLLGSPSGAVAQVAGGGPHAPVRAVRRPSPPARPIFPEAMFVVGASPEAAGVGDFDGDGHLDLAVPNSFGTSVSLLLGNGGGLFQPGSSLTTGGSPRHVAVGDLDGDTDLDLAVACGESGVQVFKNLGAGTFDAGTNYVTGAGPAWVVFAQLNAGTALDMVVANAGGNSLAVLLGTGDATFQAPATYTAGVGPSSLAVGDLNGDTKLDLVVGNGGGQRVSVLLGNGNGTFGAQQLFDCGDAPRSVVLGDLNGDLKLDVVVANATAGTVSVLLGNGNGTFGADVSYATGGTPQYVAMDDLDGDLDLDLAVANVGSTTTSSLWILRNSGNGAFGPPQAYAALGLTSGIALADFDEDGRLDAAASSYNPTSLYSPGFVTILRGKAGATFEGTVISPAAASVGELADLDGDGDLDLATVTYFTSAIYISLGDGHGGFSSLASYPVTGRPIAVTSGYIDSDTDLDLVVSAENISGPPDAPGTATILLGQGNGTFAAPMSLAVAAEPRRATLGDVDHDGDTDLAILTITGQLHMFLGNGTGAFALVPTPPPPMTSDPLLVHLEDLNGDNNVDVLGVDGYPLHTVFVRFGNGDGTFGPSQIYGTIAGSGYSADVGDVDGNGTLDVVVGSDWGNVEVILGHRDGTFGPDTTHVVPGSGTISALAIGDVDLDGKADLALRAGVGWMLLRGRGDATFHPPQSYYGGITSFGSMHLGDLDLDGDLDLVAGTATLAFASLNRTIP